MNDKEKIKYLEEKVRSLELVIRNRNQFINLVRKNLNGLFMLKSDVELLPEQLSSEKGHNLI